MCTAGRWRVRRGDGTREREVAAWARGRGDSRGVERAEGEQGDRQGKAREIRWQEWEGQGFPLHTRRRERPGRG